MSKFFAHLLASALVLSQSANVFADAIAAESAAESSGTALQLSSEALAQGSMYGAFPRDPRVALIVSATAGLLFTGSAGLHAWSQYLTNQKYAGAAAEAKMKLANEDYTIEPNGDLAEVVGVERLISAKRFGDIDNRTNKEILESIVLRAEYMKK